MEEKDYNHTFSTLNRIMDVIERLEANQSKMNAALTKVTTYAKEGYVERKDIAKDMKEMSNIVNTTVVNVAKISENMKNLPEKVNELEKYAVAFKTVPLLVKFMVLIFTLITSGFGLITLFKKFLA